MAKENYSEDAAGKSISGTEEASASLQPRPARQPAALRIWQFYRDGFREMTIGKTLWAIILIKLFIFFFILKLFFFPDILSRDYDSDEERAEAVRNHLVGGNP